MATKKRLTLKDLETLTLKAGVHSRRSMNSLCVVEAVAWFAGKPHSDHPPCVSPVIGDFLRSWNDVMNDEDRQMLKPLIPLVVGTAADAETEMRRSVMALDWLCRVNAPAWLRLAGLTTEAEAIEGTAPITSPENARAAQAALNRATSAAYRKWSAALDAAYGAAYGAARGALRPTVVRLQASAIDLLRAMIALSDAPPAGRRAGGQP